MAEITGEIGTGCGGWDNATLVIDGIGFPCQHAWAKATYGTNFHLFPCYGGSEGAECYPGTTVCEFPAPLFRLSDNQQSSSLTLPVDMVLAILVCSGITQTDAMKWRHNYDCTTNSGCNPEPNSWAQGDSSGIIYGLTGVCHQAANRILAASNGCANNSCPFDPAQTYVTQPFPSFILSWIFYGAMGAGIDTFWQCVQHRYYGGTENTPDADERQVQEHFAQSTDISLRRPIISRFILDSAADAATTEAVEQAIKATLIKKLGLDCDLISGSVTPQAFAYEVNRLAAAMLGQLGQIVGEDWYDRYNFPGAVLNFCSPLWMSDADSYRRFAHLAPALRQP